MFYRCLDLPPILNNDVSGEGTKSAILKCFKIALDLNISFTSIVVKRSMNKGFQKKGQKVDAATLKGNLGIW